MQKKTVGWWGECTNCIHFFYNVDTLYWLFGNANPWIIINHDAKLQTWTPRYGLCLSNTPLNKIPYWFSPDCTVIRLYFIDLHTDFRVNFFVSLYFYSNKENKIYTFYYKKEKKKLNDKFKSHLNSIKQPLSKRLVTRMLIDKLTPKTNWNTLELLC